MFGIFKKNKSKLPERSLEEIKRLCRLLFIDDRTFPVMEILKQAGWSNTQRIKDVESLDQPEIKEANILFVDIQGVGKKLKFQDEGLGLIIALKAKYPNKKIIAYSAEDQGQVQAFHQGINVADSRLSKHAEPYQFQFLVEKFAREAFSLNECVERIKQAILNEFGQSIETEELLKKLNKIQSKNDYSIEGVSKVFNLNNAASIANIIQLFLTGASA